MCGIAGFVGRGSHSDLVAMTTALAHRGPDGEAFYRDPGRPVFLGHRRLAIIDIPGGAQPMWNEDDTIAVLFNGEIYNHLALREALIAKGHRFRSHHSDTEVLVHGFEEWGEGLPARLNGMFAFAMYDKVRRRLFLARDRFGEKPLFYAVGRDFFAFASELSALARHPEVDRTLDRSALQKFFAYGYLPAPNTLFVGARKLPGGCHLTYDIASGDTAVKRYWRFELDPERAGLDGDEDALAEELRGLVFQSAQRRLISDVPLGVFLSGGIDSSAVLAGVADRLPPEQIKTFTVGFAEPSFDESGFAQIAAKAFRTEHHVEVLGIAEAREIVSSVLSRLDEPLGDPSILPTYLLSRFTRKHVTVALSGDGGDELFAGYDPFKALQPAHFYQRIVPRGLHRGLRKLADLLPISSRNMSLDFKIRRSLVGLSYRQALWNPVWMGAVEPELITHLFDEPLSAEELYSEAIDLWEANPKLDLVDRTLAFFTNFYLQDDILMKVDRAAMMNSLEARAVFLDNDVVDFCTRLPNRFKYRNGNRKYLLKKAMKDVLPSSILARKKKGFGIPLAKWLRDVPPSPPLVPIEGIALDWVARQWREHRRGAADHRQFLWSWLSLQALLPTPLPAR